MMTEPAYGVKGDGEVPYRLSEGRLMETAGTEKTSTDILEDPEFPVRIRAFVFSPFVFLQVIRDFFHSYNGS